MIMLKNVYKKIGSWIWPLDHSLPPLVQGITSFLESSASEGKKKRRESMWRIVWVAYYFQLCCKLLFPKGCSMCATHVLETLLGGKMRPYSQFIWGQVNWEICFVDSPYALRFIMDISTSKALKNPLVYSSHTLFFDLPHYVVFLFFPLHNLLFSLHRSNKNLY